MQSQIINQVPTVLRKGKQQAEAEGAPAHPRLSQQFTMKDLMIT